MAYIPENILDTMVKIGKITVEEEECSLDFSSPEPMTVTDSTNIYLRLAGGLNLGDVVYQVPLEGTVADGMYPCTVTTETISPMKLSGLMGSDPNITPSPSSILFAIITSAAVSPWRSPVTSSLPVILSSGIFVCFLFSI